MNSSKLPRIASMTTNNTTKNITNDIKDNSNSINDIKDNSNSIHQASNSDISFQNKNNSINNMKPPIFNQQNNKKKRKNSITKTTLFPSYINNLLERISITTLSHPFLLLSVTMITNTSYYGCNWLFSYFK